MSTDLMKTIARVRRAMPRNADVMEICDALEAKLSTVKQTYEHTEIGYAFTTNENGDRVGNHYEKKFDKTAYMRDYMRKRRAKRS